MKDDDKEKEDNMDIIEVIIRQTAHELIESGNDDLHDSGHPTLNKRQIDTIAQHVGDGFTFFIVNQGGRLE